MNVRMIEDGKTTINTHFINVPKLLSTQQIIDIYDLKFNAKLLRELDYILNTIMYHSMYNTKNLEMRIDKLNKINASKQNKDMVILASKIERDLSYLLFEELEKILKEIDIRM